MGILCPVILPATCVVPPRNTKFAQHRAVGSELVGHDGGWSDALLLQEFSHQLERRLAVSPWLNEDVQDLAFAVHGTPDVQLSAVDGDEALRRDATARPAEAVPVYSRPSLGAASLIRTPMSPGYFDLGQRRRVGLHVLLQ